MRELLRLLRHPLTLVAAVVVASGALPLWLAWAGVWSAPTIGVPAALALLTDPAANASMVDVRPAAEYEAWHLAGALHWSAADILALDSAAQMPESFRNRALLLICDSGIQGAQAARKLAALGIPEARNVEGGLQAWIGDVDATTPDAYARWRLASGALAPLPYRNSSPVEQAAVFVGGFGIKSLYMLLALGLALWVGRRREAEFVALSAGLLTFFVAEVFCWINFPLGRAESALLEYGHSFGMVVCIGALAFALIEGADRRIVHFSHPKAHCVMLPLCRACVKHNAAPCGLMRLFRVGIPALGVVALMPLGVTPAPDSYNTRVFGVAVNFTHHMLNQLYESRFAPLAALALFGAAFALVAFVRHGDLLAAKILFAAGIGHLGFAFMRVALLSFYRDNLVWFAFWEEATELILIAGIGLVLWFFRHGLELPLPGSLQERAPAARR